MSVRALPDVEGLVVAYLTAHADLIEAFGESGLEEARVSTDLPESAERPYLTISDIAPRTRSPHWITVSHLQLTSWGPDPASEPFSRDIAFEVCSTAVAVLHEIPQIHELGIAGGVEDIFGPRSIPDPVTSWPRFIAEALLTTHPGAEGS